MKDYLLRKMESYEVKGKTVALRRPIQKLYPLEITRGTEEVEQDREKMDKRTGVKTPMVTEESWNNVCCRQGCHGTHQETASLILDLFCFVETL